MKKTKKILIMLIILVILLIIGFLTYNKFFKKQDEEVKVIKTISKYGYTLDENETKIYKDEFDKLDEILSNDIVDNELYAKQIAKLFVIDFYTLSNKLSKNDIGGTQFIKEDMKDNFIEQARSTFYKYIEVKDDKRNQELPEVSEIKNISVLKTTFTIKDKMVTTTKYKKSNGKTYDAYKITISWDYKEDYGYEKEANIIIVEDDNKLSIVEMD